MEIWLLTRTGSQVTPLSVLEKISRGVMVRRPPEARAAFAAAAARLTAAGITLANRHADPVIEEVEGVIADSAQLTRTINAWEGRWPLNTYRDRDTTKLSRSALERSLHLRNPGKNGPKRARRCAPKT